MPESPLEGLGGSSRGSLSIGIVILAGGRGTRAGDSPCPKQYRRIAGETIISRTLKVFRRWDPICPIVIVRHADDASVLEASISRGANTYDTTGGSIRFVSARNGLRCLADLKSPPSHVLIHDGVRPFVSQTLLQRLKAALVETPQVGIIPILPMCDTVKKIDGAGFVVSNIDREVLCRAQTPQAFGLPSILELYELADKARDNSITDDSALFTWAGKEIRTVQGDHENVKLTYPEDFVEAERRLQSGSSNLSVPDIRVGHGYDTHRLVPSEKRDITLCGITVPNDYSLLGHSDADVALHALTNAVLGTVAAADIGAHFPPTDPQWKGVSSDRFLRHAVSIVAEAGGIITNVDLSIMCERPRIHPHRDAMRASIAKIMNLDIQRVSVKAGTNETMGFVGREEGIVALATATVIFPSAGAWSHQ